MKFSSLAGTFWYLNDTINIDIDQTFNVMVVSGDTDPYSQLVLDKNNNSLYLKTPPSNTWMIYQNGEWASQDYTYRQIVFDFTGNDLTNKELIDWFSNNAEFLHFWTDDPSYRVIDVGLLNFIGSFDDFPTDYQSELYESYFANIANNYYAYAGSDGWLQIELVGIFDYDKDFIPMPLYTNNFFGTYMAEKVTDLMPENEG